MEYWRGGVYAVIRQCLGREDDLLVQVKAVRLNGAAVQVIPQTRVARESFPNRVNTGVSVDA